MANWFVSRAGYDAVTEWVTGAKSTGAIYRPTAPTGTNHRCYRVTGGDGSDSTEPPFSSYLTKGATFTHEGVSWVECSGASADNPTSFLAPHAWLEHACESGWSAAGDTIYVDTLHAETQSAQLNIATTGTRASPIRIICINSTFSNPPVSGDVDTTPGASVISTTTSSTGISFSGSFYCYGITFESGSGAGNHGPFNLGDYMDTIWDKCTFKCIASGAGGGEFKFMAAGGAIVKLYDCVFEFASAGTKFALEGSNVHFFGGSLGGSAVPSSLFVSTNGFSASAHFHGFDFNSAGTWTAKYICNLTNLQYRHARIYINNSKFAASLSAPCTGALHSDNRQSLVRVTNSDSDDVTTGRTTYKEWSYQYGGTLTHETTVVRTGGASDGTTSKAWGVVTNASNGYHSPFVCPDIFTWVDSTGSKNFDIYIANTVEDLDEADLWIEFEYMGATNDPRSTVYSDRPNPLSTGSTNWTDDTTSTWGSSPTYMQKCRITKTINQKGWVRARINIAKASSTIYIDPMINVS